AAVSEVLSVAAADARIPDPTVTQPTSAVGPALINFPAPEVRNVPNITGVDCVQTRVGQLGFFENPFCGTSAAAPHVAGIAALLMERAPGLSSAQYRAILTGTAVDIESPGFDFLSGFGRVDALAALQSIGNTAVAAAVLPASRSVPVGTAATAYATMILAGNTSGIACSIALTTSIPAAFTYQTTDPATNQPTGIPNTPVNIVAKGSQTFVISITPSGPFPPTD